MVPFVLLAAVLSLGAVAAVATPLLKKAATAPSHWAALAVTGLLTVGPVVLYVSWSNWPWRTAAAADTPQSMVARLARRLEQNPGDLSGWLMLGRSYTVLEEFPLAVRAFERAKLLSGGKSAEALVGEAEALALEDESELDGRAGRLVDQALAVAPEYGQALLLGATVAERRGDLPLARQRLAKLLAMDPPQNLRPILEQQIRVIDEKLAVAPGAGAGSGAPPATVSGTGEASPVVSVNVTLAPALARETGVAPLFVFVRDPGKTGPPLAVKRLESHFPQRVALTPSDSMVPGRAFAAGQSVEVVARIARSGSPIGASGDPFGQVTYHVGRDGLVSLVIDRLTP